MHSVYVQLFQNHNSSRGGHVVAVRQAFVIPGFLIASTIFAQAADPVHLRVADSFPKGHYLVRLVQSPSGDSTLMTSAP
jgi:peptidoglycan/LPS O-acetylase OafA/YrhL